MKNSVWNAFVQYQEGADGGPGFAHRTTGTVLPLTEVVPQPLVKPTAMHSGDIRDAAYPSEPGAGVGAGVRDRAWDRAGGGGESAYAGASEYQAGEEYGVSDVNGSAGHAGGGGGVSGFEGLSDEVGIGVGVWALFGWV